VGLSRVPDSRYSEAIAEAFRTIGQGFADRLANVQFVCGVDPVFAGLHDYRTTVDSRAYASTAHCCYSFHIKGPADRRTTTIVLPKPPRPSTVVHELGHALHAQVGFDYIAQPCTTYARTDQYEAFAEAFTARHYIMGDEAARQADKQTIHLLDLLGACG
jgi:hypothetical protein